MGIREIASKVALEFGWNKPTPERMAGWRVEKGLPEQAEFDFDGLSGEEPDILASQAILRELDVYATKG